MAERPPSRPRVAWEEKAAPRERRSPQEPYEVTMVEPLRTDETLPEEKPEHPELPPAEDSESSRSLSSLDSEDSTVARNMQVLLPDIVESLQDANEDAKKKALVFLRTMMESMKSEKEAPSQVTGTVLTAIEALAADDLKERQMGINILTVAVLDPGYWLRDVPKFMRLIHSNVERIRVEPARRSLDSFLLRMTQWYPKEVVRSLLEISPRCDSAALAMWEVMISMPWTLWSVLSELLNVLQDRRVHKVFSSAWEDACIYHLSLLLHSDIDSQEFAALYKVQPYLRWACPVMLSLVLSVLITLLKKPGTARKMQVLLPDIVESLQDANEDAKRKALVFLRTMMESMKSEKEATHLLALQLAEKLPALFADESSEVRELSISLFQEALKAVVGRKKKQLKEKVWRVLLPLFLHANDQVERVAKASKDTLLTCAEFLAWRKLSHLAQTNQTHLIGEALVRTSSKPQGWAGRGLPRVPVGWPWHLCLARDISMAPQGLCPPCPQGAEEEPGPSGPWQWGQSVPPGLCLQENSSLPHPGPGLVLQQGYFGLSSRRSRVCCTLLQVSS